MIFKGFTLEQRWGVHVNRTEHRVLGLVAPMPLDPSAHLVLTNPLLAPLVAVAGFPDVAAGLVLKPPRQGA